LIIFLRESGIIPYVELPGEEHMLNLGDTATQPVEITERVLSTIMFADIVGSTEQASDWATGVGTRCSTSMIKFFVRSSNAFRAA
jgi:hypothetical protein